MTYIIVFCNKKKNKIINKMIHKNKILNNNLNKNNPEQDKIDNRNKILIIYLNLSIISFIIQIYNNLNKDINLINNK